MTKPACAWLPGGRLHLQHGPIDLVIKAEGDGRIQAMRAAGVRFASVLDELVGELPLLRAPTGPDAPWPDGEIARHMARSARPHGARCFVTPMAAVAGAVADTIMVAMTGAGRLTRAYVNNGGDIALHLTPGTSYRAAMAGTDGAGLGEVLVTPEQGIGGIATSGRRGRSLSMGIADSVTVLAATAAAADVAATLIANAVDLPGHPAIVRQPATQAVPDSDLGERLVVMGLGRLGAAAAGQALDRGEALADRMRAEGLIDGAALFLGAESRLVGLPALTGSPGVAAMTA